MGQCLTRAISRFAVLYDIGCLREVVCIGGYVKFRLRARGAREGMTTLPTKHLEVHCRNAVYSVYTLSIGCSLAFVKDFNAVEWRHCIRQKWPRSHDLYQLVACLDDTLQWTVESCLYLTSHSLAILKLHITLQMFARTLEEWNMERKAATYGPQHKI